MNELMRSLEGDHAKAKHDVPKEIYGVLAAHIKSIQLLMTEYAQGTVVNSSSLDQLQLQLEVCEMTMTLPLHSNNSDEIPEADSRRDNEIVVCDQLKHFTVESDSVLAKGTLSLRHIIQGSPLSGSCELKDLESGAPFATVTADWTFCYGRLGYGESYQLKHGSHHHPGDYLYYSLFPRQIPSDQNSHGSGLMMNLYLNSHPVFIPFRKHAKLCIEKSVEGVKDSPPSALIQLMNSTNRLRNLHRQLEEKKDRGKRLRFLEDIVYSACGLQPNQSTSHLPTSGGAS